MWVLPASSAWNCDHHRSSSHACGMSRRRPECRLRFVQRQGRFAPRFPFPRLLLWRANVADILCPVVTARRSERSDLFHRLAALRGERALTDLAPLSTCREFRASMCYTVTEVRDL